VVKCIFLSGIFIFAGCASFSTFQSPQVLEPGKRSLGIGISETINPDENKMVVGPLDIYGRFGIVRNIDVGIKLSGGIPFPLPPWVVLFADVKYQFSEKPLIVSGDLGYSLFRLEDITTYGIYPMVLLGNEYFYSGLKIVYLSSSGLVNLIDSAISFKWSTAFPGITIGTIFGDKTKVFLEGNFYFSSGSEPPLIFLGFAVQQIF